MSTGSPRKRPATRKTPAAPRRPTQERSKRTVESILDAAESLMKEPGPNGALQMRAVARLAGVGQGTLYEYFPTLEAVRAALETRAWEKLVVGLQATLLEVRTEPLPTAVRRVTEGILEGMIVPAKLHGLRADSPLFQDSRRDLVTNVVAICQAELTARGERIVIEDGEMGLTVVAMAVALLISVGVRDYEEHYRSGRFTRQVADLVTRYLTG